MTEIAHTTMLLLGDFLVLTTMVRPNCWDLRTRRLPLSRHKYLMDNLSSVLQNQLIKVFDEDRVFLFCIPFSIESTS